MFVKQLFEKNREFMEKKKYSLKEADKKYRRIKNYYKFKRRLTALIFLIICFFLYDYYGPGNKRLIHPGEDFLDCQEIKEEVELLCKDLPAYQGNAYVTLRGNIPDFTREEISEKGTYAFYGKLDKYKRATVCQAMLSKEMFPKGERGDISQITPTGFHTVIYDNVPDGYLYNRCHLIAFCLAGEDDNERNLITGTRYLNVSGMYPFEMKIQNYMEKTGNRVIYRVVPVFSDTDLVCRGVFMEAYSVEDMGRGLSFCVFCYNVQPGIVIDYGSGKSRKGQ